MTFLGSFGKKITSTIADYGRKETQLVNKGVKFAADNFVKAAGVAGKVGDVAGTAAGIAAATGIGEPLAVALGGVAGAAKVAQKGLGTVGSAAIGIESARGAVSELKRGNVKGAISKAQVAKTAGSVVRKRIQR